MIGHRAGAALLLALCASACRAGGSAPAGARLTARWTGADTARFSAHAVAEWCASLHLLEIRAVAGDTGVGIALYPPGTLESGTYPIRRPEVADTTHPPSAAVALRWFSQTMVKGFQGDSGGVTLERRPDGSLAGRFTARARPFTTGAGVHLTGSFDGLRVVAAPNGCAGRPPSDTAKADTRADTTD